MLLIYSITPRLGFCPILVSLYRIPPPDLGLYPSRRVILYYLKKLNCSACSSHPSAVVYSVYTLPSLSHLLLGPRLSTTLYRLPRIYYTLPACFNGLIQPRQITQHSSSTITISHHLTQHHRHQPLNPINKSQGKPFHALLNQSQHSTCTSSRTSSCSTPASRASSATVQGDNAANRTSKS